MSTSDSSNDPLEFTRNLWSQMGFSLPGMVTPTFDVSELDKRLTDLKTVESWLKMNLSMLQLTIQGLEMQCTTLNAVRSLGNLNVPEMTVPPGPAHSATEETPAGKADAMQSAMWPWALMQQIQSQMQEVAEKQVAGFAPGPKAKAKPGAKKP